MTPEAIAEIAGRLTAGAQLGLANHAGGQPDWWEITEACPPNKAGQSRSYRHVIAPLLKAGLLSEVWVDLDGGRRGRQFPLTKDGVLARQILAHADA